MRESFDEHSPLPPYSEHEILDRSEYLKESERPAHGFKSPASFEERLDVLLRKLLSFNETPQLQELWLRSGLPMHWQRILNYMHKAGVVDRPEIYFYPQRNDRPKLYNGRLRLSTKPDADAKDAGFGASLDAEQAISKTIGEALERFFLSHHSAGSLPTGSYFDWRKKHRTLDLTLMNNFLPWQKERFAALAWNEQSPLRWVQTKTYPDGDTAWVPAQLIFWGYEHGEEKALARMTTSGCAGHFSRDHAILSGLLESIERDGFLIYWLNKLPPKRIAIDEVADPEIQKLLSYLQRYRLEPIFLDTTTDLNVPSMACVLIDYSAKHGPVISLGGSAGFDLRDCVVRSVTEALIINSYTDNLPIFELPVSYVAFSDETVHRRERLSLWKGRAMLEEFGFFITGDRESAEAFMRGTARYETLQDRLDHVVEQMHSLGPGYEIYVYEAESKILDTLGYHAVRTLVPRLIPLYLWEYAAPLGSDRLKTVPPKLGHSPAQEVYGMPHPFP